MRTAEEQPAWKRLIAGAVLDAAGLGLIAFSFLHEQSLLLLGAGVGLIALGSALVVRWARERSSLEAAPPAGEQAARWILEPELASPPRRRAAITASGRWRMGLWLAAVTAAVLYAGGYPRRAAPMETELSRYGVETDAVIHDKRQRNNAEGQPRYYLYYNFSDRRGERVRASTAVSESVYGAHREGDTVRVVYLREDPLSHQVRGVEKGRLRREGLAVLAALLAALAALERQRRRHKRLVEEGSAVGGAVVEVKRLGAASSYTVLAKTAGVERRLRHTERPCRLRAGDRVTVLYLPRKPSDALLYRAAVYRALR